MRRAISLLAVLVGLSGAGQARAEAPGDFVAAMGLTAADGTVRTQASVRLAITAASGAGDHVVAMRAPVQARLAEMRQCFGEAMARTPTVEGRVVFELEAMPRGKAKAQIALDETNDAPMAECMRKSLSRTELKGIPQGARALVSLDLSNPSAAVRAKMRRDLQSVDVRVVSGGRAQSEGATQQGEVQFRISGSAYAREAIAELHRDVSSRLAGLLDCRRKASRRNRPAEGTVTVDLRLGKGRMENVKPSATGIADRNAPACVVKWLERADRTHLVPAELELAITFAR